jgi:hypothetical protein
MENCGVQEVAWACRSFWLFLIPALACAETSDHVTLGGKDEWGKKKRSFRKGESLPTEEGRFWSAPWKFMRLGRGSDNDKENIANFKALKLVLCRHT